MQMILKALFWAFAYRYANAGQFFLHASVHIQV